MSSDLDDVDALYKELDAAMENHANQSERFITEANITRILNDAQLIRVRDRLFKRRLSKSKRSEYLQQMKKPSRIVVLAILVYGRRQKALGVFKQWLSSPGTLPPFPVDRDLPLLPAQAEALFGIDAQEILNNQPMFLPMVLRANLHQNLRSGHRNPYIDRISIGNGSSGLVYRVKIPQGYWKYEEAVEHQSPAAARVRTNDNEIVLAVKRFRKTGNVDAASASRNFNHEREFLAGLRKEKASHEHILHDLGSITSTDSDGNIHDLLFPYAACNLYELLTGKQLGDHLINRLTVHHKAGIFQNAVDVSGALSFLHFYNKQHLDIKPDNILVFKKPNSAELSWVISDFNFSHNQGARPESLQELSDRFKSSSDPFPEAFRVGGIFQAPEVRELPNRNSQPGKESDVWSMGCLLLMVIAYLDDREHSVEALYENLKLKCRTGTVLRSFYMTPEMHEWTEPNEEISQQASQSTFAASLDRLSASPRVKETKLVDINPRVLQWMDSVCEDALQKEIPESGGAKFVETVVNYIRKKVVVIDPEKRVSAKALHESLDIVLKGFKKDITQANEPTPRLGTSQPAIQITDIDSTPRIIDRGKQRDESNPSMTLRDNDAKALVASNEPKEVLQHTDICKAARCGKIEQLFYRDPDASLALNEPCPRCEEYPLHMVLLNQDQKSLRKLLDFEDLDSINSLRKNCRRTPIELACCNGGNRQILKDLLRHPKLQFSEEIYQRLKPLNLKENVRKLLEDSIGNQRNSQSGVDGGAREEVSVGRVNSSSDLSREVTSGTDSSTLSKSRGFFKGLGRRKR